MASLKNIIQDKDGNVGIGTYTPAQKLHVEGGVIRATGGTSNAKYIQINVNDSWGYLTTTASKFYLDSELRVDTGLIGSYNEDLQLRTSGTTRLIINNTSGNVGIGTTSPYSLLHISGSGNTFTRYTNTTNIGHYVDVGANSAGQSFVYSYGAYPLLIGTNGTTRMTVTSGGNVGIGTTSPGYKLDVSEAARALGVRIGRDFSVSNRATVRLDSYGDNPADILFGRDTAASQTSWNGVYWSISSRNSGLGTAEGNKFTIWRGAAHASPNNSESQFLTITPDLNLGIGTTSPAQKLEVSGNILASKIGTGGSINTSYDLYNNGTTYLNGETIVDDNLYVTSGNVGIGTTSPSQKLHVSGNAQIDYSLIGRGFRSPGRGELYLNATGSNDVSEMFFGYGSGYTENNIRWGISDRGATLGQLNFYRGPAFGSFATTLTLYSNLNASFYGNVGIGTTSPEAELDVNGRIAIRSSNRLYFGHTTTLNSWTTAQYASSSTHVFNAQAFVFNNEGYGSTEYMRITSAGNVGIGTAGPYSLLQVGDPEQTTPAELTIASRYDGGGPILNFRTDHPNNANQWNMARIVATDDGNYNGRLEFRTTVSSGYTGVQPTTKMVIKANGNVGIGTTSPQEKLHIAGSSVLSWDSGAGYGIKYYSGGTYELGFRLNIGDRALDIYSIYDDNADGINFITGTGSSNSVKVKFANNGNVGIGETNPTTKLYIKNTSGDADITLQGSSQTMRIDQNSIRTTTASQISIFTNNTATNGIYISSAGNVGIGTTSPTYKLDVYGDIRSGGADPVMLLQPDSGTYTFFQKLSTSNGDYLRLYDGTSYSMFWKGGNVGIGTTSPQSKLHVQGGVGIFNVSDDWHQSSSGTHIFRGSQFNSSINEQSTAIKVFSGNAVRTAGDYWGGVGFMHLDPQNSSWGGTFTGEHFWIGGRVIDTPGQERSALVFATNNGTTAGTHSSERMVILPNGNVGIGTTSPSSNLHVNSAGGSGVTTQIKVTQADDGAGHAGADAILQSSGWGEAYLKLGGHHLSAAGGDFNVQSASDLNFKVNGGTSAMFINTSSNVGIGTTSPGELLDVRGNIRFGTGGSGSWGEGLLTMNSGWGTGKYPTLGSYDGSAGSLIMLHNPHIPFRTDNAASASYTGRAGLRMAIDTAGTGWWDAGLAGDFYHIFKSTGGEFLRITNTGNVGIGTTSPAYKLDVSGGAIAIRGNAAGNSLRFDDTTATSRNAMYVDTSNYLNIGNANYAGVKLVHTATAPQANGLEGNQIAEGFGTTENGKVLAEPTAWLAVRVGTTDYAIPMYSVG